MRHLEEWDIVNFPIVNFPFLSSNTLLTPAYGVHVRYARATSILSLNEKLPLTVVPCTLNKGAYLTLSGQRSTVTTAFRLVVHSTVLCIGTTENDVRHR